MAIVMLFVLGDGFPDLRESSRLLDCQALSAQIAVVSFDKSIHIGTLGWADVYPYSQAAPIFDESGREIAGAVAAHPPGVAVESDLLR